MKLAERIFKRTDYKETSPYGTRIHPVTKEKSFHYGVDYGTQLEYWNQYALEDGFIVNCGADGSSMNALFAWVEYPRLQLRLLHYHLDLIKVKKGQKVDENTVIGTTGKTGRATGIHLHLGVKVKKNNRWVYIDPNTIDYQPEVKEVKQSFDGIWDKEFTKQLQRHFGTYVDGIISGQKFACAAIEGIDRGINGSNLIRAMQLWLNVDVDGQLNPLTIRALQKRMGTLQDAYVSRPSSLVKEMQSRLAKGEL